MAVVHLVAKLDREVETLTQGPRDTLLERVDARFTELWHLDGENSRLLALMLHAFYAGVRHQRFENVGRAGHRD